MGRATRLFVFAWACVALAFEVHLVARGWGEFQTLAALLFAVMLGLSFLSRRAVGAVLATTYVLPAVVTILHGDYFIFFEGLWLAALLGAMASDCVRGSWRVPAPWRAPLVCWALTAAVGTTIVVLREIDFDPAVFDSPWILWSSQIGVAPSFAATWVAYVGVTLVVGILWFDWLFGLSAADFRAAVIAPLLGSALVMAAVATYQLLGHSLFLNETIFGGMGRAAGTLRDANLCAAVAAIWAGGAMVWSERLGRLRAPVVGVSWLLGAVAVWAAGSRTGLALMLVVGAFVAAGLYFEYRSTRPGVMRAAAAGCVALVALGLYLAKAHPELVGPVRRLADMLPSLSATSLQNFFAELWNRNRYGIAAAAMIRDFPLVGVGAGAYQILVPDYAAASSPGGWIIADNAQNWYRHQLAEFGLLGSLGWIVWLGLFAWFVVQRRGRTSSALSVWTLRGVLVGLALISLLGMPTQDALLAITFWTFAFWFASTVGLPASADRLGWGAWAAVFVVVVAFGIGTADVAATHLRPPLRAERFGWPYTYGFYDPEPDGHGGEFRWAARRAVTVLDVKGPWLAITVSTNHRDLDRSPDDARVWCDGRLVLRARLRSAEPVTEFVRVPPGEPRLVLETHSSRVVKPRDEGLADDRELGLMVSWRFVDAPPPGAANAAVK